MKFLGAPLEAVIFDVDDVLINTVEVFFRNIREAIHEVGLPTEPFEEYCRNILSDKMHPITQMDRMARHVWPCISRQKIEQLEHAYERRSVSSHYIPIEGAVETVRWLHDQGIALAICSNARRSSIGRRFELAGIAPALFRYIHCRDNGVCKPDPVVFDGIFAQVKVERAHALFVGDMTIDFFAARGAGVPFAGVLTGFTSKKAFRRVGVPSTHIFQKLADIRGAIEI